MGHSVHAASRESAGPHSRKSQYCLPVLLETTTENWKCQILPSSTLSGKIKSWSKHQPKLDSFRRIIVFAARTGERIKEANKVRSAVQADSCGHFWVSPTQSVSLGSGHCMWLLTSTPPCARGTKMTAMGHNYRCSFSQDTFFGLSGKSIRFWKHNYRAEVRTPMLTNNVPFPLWIQTFLPFTQYPSSSHPLLRGLLDQHPRPTSQETPVTILNNCSCGKPKNTLQCYNTNDQDPDRSAANHCPSPQGAVLQGTSSVQSHH